MYIVVGYGRWYYVEEITPEGRRILHYTTSSWEFAHDLVRFLREGQ